ncbi:hypothetical protein [Streptomyces sp. NBC_00343]|uniref:hypothetical protein n=1 Tax=unclassified Streptomyces TaxID=2593676 RepID=UPI003FA72501
MGGPAVMRRQLLRLMEVSRLQGRRGENPAATHSHPSDPVQRPHVFHRVGAAGPDRRRDRRLQ